MVRMLCAFLHPELSDMRTLHRYPRARGLGGCTVHNAVVNFVGNIRQDFANLEKLFGDSWSLENVWEYFKLIERNSYILNSTEHGYSGWLGTNGLDQTVLSTYAGESYCYALLH